MIHYSSQADRSATVPKRRTMKKLFVTLALLLPCFALVSCKSELLSLFKVRAENQVNEQKIVGKLVRAKVDGKINWRYSIILDSPESAKVVKVTFIDEQTPIEPRLVHEAGKCTITWDVAPKSRPPKDPYRLAVSFSDGSESTVKVQDSLTLIGWTVGILGLVVIYCPLWIPFVF